MVPCHFQAVDMQPFLRARPGARSQSALAQSSPIRAESICCNPLPPQDQPYAHSRLVSAGVHPRDQGSDTAVVHLDAKARNPNKPLVLSFHGTAGVGKNHVTKIIARNVYEKGENSKHVRTFISQYHFPHKEKSDLYSAQLKQWIHGNVSSFPHSMFIFDEMDKLNPQLIDTLKPFLDYNAHVDGVSFHNAIFIFLSNTGGSLIVDMALNFWREGKKREEISMNSNELETKISLHIFNEEGGFQHSSLIDHHLVDHYIPFLPLELKHVRQCVVAEMVNLNMTEDFDLADKVAREMPFFPETEKIFSVKGCKSVRQKLGQQMDE